MELSNGKSLVRILHPDFRKGFELEGKCADLESAYKQLPVRPSHGHWVTCAVKNPITESVEYFELHALPFGASAAVHGFNRAAMAIEHIFTKVFGIPCTHYFDDFIFIAPKEIMGDLVELARDALSLLGWKVKGGDKDLPPSDRFVALGVVFDLKRTDEPVPMLDISNKESRVKTLLVDIEEILTKGRLSP